VYLREADVELAHGADDQGGQQRSPVGAVEAVQSASEAIVAEEAGLPWLEAKVLRNATGNPLGETIEGAACEEQVGYEGAEEDGSGNRFGTPCGGRQVACEELLELEAVEEAADDGRGADFEGFERGLVERSGHRCLNAGDVGREGCYGGRREGGKKKRGSKKSSLG
jgi:hypothetical protein